MQIRLIGDLYRGDASVDVLAQKIIATLQQVERLLPTGIIWTCNDTLISALDAKAVTEVLANAHLVDDAGQLRPEHGVHLSCYGDREEKDTVSVKFRVASSVDSSRESIVVDLSRCKGANFAVVGDAIPLLEELIHLWQPSQADVFVFDMTKSIDDAPVTEVPCGPVVYARNMTTLQRTMLSRVAKQAGDIWYIPDLNVHAPISEKQAGILKSMLDAFHRGART